MNRHTPANQPRGRSRYTRRQRRWMDTDLRRRLENARWQLIIMPGIIRKTRESFRRGFQETQRRRSYSLLRLCFG